MDKVLDLINKKNKELRKSLSLDALRRYFIPRIIPSIACSSFGVTGRQIVLIAEEQNLFQYPELIIRVPRVCNNVVKSSTTVLFSLMGLLVLKELILEIKKRKIATMPVGKDEGVLKFL